MSGLPEIDGLRQAFDELADTMSARAPRWAQVARRLAVDTDADAVLRMLLEAPPEQRRPVLAMAALHDLTLTDPHEPLGVLLRRPPTDDVSDEALWAAVVDLVARRRFEFAERIRTCSTQTNEVGRCAVLLPALSAVADEMGPLGLVELGSSAGLLLNLDRYQYRYPMGDDLVTVAGDPSATPTLVLNCSVQGRVELPRSVPPLASRLGVDPQPVDVNDEAATRWLAACVWPDQHDRLQTLRSALDVARRWPVSCVRDDGVDRTPVELACATGHPVLMTSWALTYVPAPRRRLLWERLQRLGQERDLSAVVFEDPALIPEFPVPRRDDDRGLTVLALFRWRSGRLHTERRGTAHPHGYWWHPSS